MLYNTHGPADLAEPRPDAVLVRLTERDLDVARTGAIVAAALAGHVVEDGDGRSPAPTLGEVEAVRGHRLVAVEVEVKAWYALESDEARARGVGPFLPGED